MAADATSRTPFPADFIWGAATSAYQVEGAAATDGRGPSLWDTFSHTPGNVLNGATGDVAADQYHRYPEDIALMQTLGLRSYRFSISWSRVLPTGKGEVNQLGLDYYKRLVDALNAAGIEPMPTLFHWDTPQPLHDKGGWESRDTALYFGEYADVVYRALGSQVKTFLTVNEPKTVVQVGYLFGQHAPGKKDLAAATRVLHHLNLGHGLAVQALRASGVQAQIGPALNLTPMYPADDSPEALAATAVRDVFENRVYLDPMIRGTYPEDGLDQVFDKPALEAVIKDGDLEIISTPNDLLAINYYAPGFVGPNQESVIKYPIAEPTFWLEIYPPGLHDLLVRIDRDYGQPRMIITENGRPTVTPQAADGSYPDDERIEFVRDHLVQAAKALAAGVKLEGYQLWSLMDNFEWAEGYEQRWGLVHIDFDTLERTPKKSFHWYAEVIRSGGASLFDSTD